jgi:hypothetical protein
MDTARQSLVLAREIGNRQIEWQALGHIGNSYRHLGNVEGAVEAMQASLSLGQTTGRCQRLNHELK